MRMAHVLRVELKVWAALVVVAGSVGWLSSFASGNAATGYENVAADLEPFRAAFNAASEDVRAVLLVGPT